jgi:acylphosphatase
MARAAARILVEGRVQGVGFRWWVVAQATGLGLAGWVRNLSDGRVEVLAIGEPDAIEQLTESCGRGPPGAMVRSVGTEAAEDDGANGFEQRATV